MYPNDVETPNLGVSTIHPMSSAGELLANSINTGLSSTCAFFTFPPISRITTAIIGIGFRIGADSCALAIYYTTDFVIGATFFAAHYTSGTSIKADIVGTDLVG
jgi:hypothetical protein